MIDQVKAKAQQWLDPMFDAETRERVQHLLQHDETELVECFYKDLEFGTGGLRGIMGVGTNRMNIYTVGMATQGLCNYLKKNFKNLSQIKVAIAHDSRNNSPLFAQTTAKICAANGIKAYLFNSLRPTPELSFAIRELGCQSGVVITASHNPKEYNGYKAYWDDGAQLTAPHDTNVVNEARAIRSIAEVKFSGNDHLIETLDDKFDELYLDQLKTLSLSPQIIAQQRDMKIVYTPIHGTGVRLAPAALRRYGFNNIINVPEQDISDGNFPTVKSPNPENAEALTLALKKATDTGADLVLATDPDSDRVGIAVRNDRGEFMLLNGNQTGSLLIYYLVSQWANNGKLNGKQYVVKTIVTTELIVDIARKFKVDYHDVLTGFKYIAELIKQNEGKRTFIGGGEESYGYLAGEFVRDKDAIMSCALIAETAAWARSQGKSLFDVLVDIYLEFGFYKESLVDITKKGKSGAEEIQTMMAGYRSNPPATIGGQKVVMVKDYETRKATDFTTGKQSDIDLPKSNVLQFFLADGSKISVRPSGTEPKIKFYFGVKGELKNRGDFYKVNEQLGDRIKAIIAEMKLND